MKVFLSSTYLDLIEHRKAAHDALERIGQEVGRMEIFGARAEEATSVALDQLEKSDLVIGIYAYRYGFIPEGSDISITEQEYVHAKSKGKPVLCFVVDEDQPWSPKMMEKDAGKIRKLEDFKAKVLKEKVVDFFTTPADLGMKVATSVHNYLSEHKPIPNSQSLIPNRQSTNTLPTQPYFFGRAKELEIIASALSHESRTWGALIDGPGGIGKTALAIEAAHRAPDDLFERKIFITAKVRELNADGEAKLTDFTRPTYLAMLDELGKELGADGLEKLAPDERPDELRLALAGKKALIIFDNLETLPEEERTRLFQFLSRLPEGNKAIATSRRGRRDIDARSVRLDRLSHDESLQLIEELAKKYPRLDRASQKEREDLYEITQGNPLFIRWIAGQLGRAGSQCRTIAEACAFIDKAPKGNDPLEYIFGDLLETFTADETKVLAALTYFSLPAKLEWLAEMTKLPERQAETALEDLTDRSILISNLESLTFFLPPLTAKFIRTRRPEAVTQTGDALTDRAYALAMQYGGENYDGFRTLDAEWDFIAAALPRLLTGDNDRLQTVCGQLFQFLHFTGRLDDLLWLSEQAETRALAANNKEKAGWQAYRTGAVYHIRNQPAEMLACAARTIEHWQDSMPFNKAVAIQLRGLGHQLNNDYPAAIAAFRESLEIHRSISPESNYVAIALNDLAGAEQLNKDYFATERDYREALRIGKKNNDHEAGDCPHLM